MQKDSFSFNDGKSQNVIAFLPANQAWTVFRQDGEFSGNQRIYSEYHEAKADFDKRNAFCIEMGVA